MSCFGPLDNGGDDHIQDEAQDFYDDVFEKAENLGIMGLEK